MVHILENRQYTGCTVNFATTIISYKVHKRLDNPAEKQQIIPDTHEAIIDDATFERVQELRRHRIRPTATGRKSLFSGLVYCTDCGAKLYFSASKSTKHSHNNVKVDIYFTEMGMIDIPTEQEITKLMAEIQKDPQRSRIVV